MDKIFIEGQKTISGSVKISGAKKAVMPIKTAA
jgi:UDP-N-acetylglucosamine enolpyruvyl transferase